MVEITFETKNYTDFVAKLPKVDSAKITELLDKDFITHIAIVKGTSDLVIIIPGIAHVEQRLVGSVQKDGKE